MLIDTHCHLTDERFVDVSKSLEEARFAGVEKVIIPSTSLLDAKKAIEIAAKENQYCLVGIHPEEVGDMEPGTTLQIMEEMSGLIKSSKRVVGVGEIGLDYYWDKEKKTEAKQLEVFRGQMQLAVQLDLPVAIHMRGAEDEMINELKAFKKLPRGQFHCFAGSEEFLAMVLNMGFYVSFCGNVTYKSAESLRQLARRVPLDRLLLETDAPYLPPEPLRGTVNAPANVKITAAFLAKELSIELPQLAETTTQNAKCLYSLDI